MHHQHSHHHRRRQDPFGGFASAVENFNPFGGSKNPPPAPAPPPSQGGNNEFGQGQSTVYQTVMVTMTYGNGNDGSSPTSQDDGSEASSAPDAIDTDSAQPSAVPTDEASQQPQSLVPTSQSIPSTLAVATDTPTAVNAGTSSSTAATLNTSSGSSDPSIGAKAGIAIGVLAGILGFFLLIFFIFQKRKKQREQERLEDDEKTENPFADPAVAPRAGSRAPRLSLRPVTQFMPNLGRSAQHPDRRQSRGAMIAMVQNPQSPHPPPSQGMWDRPSTSASNHRANPFGNHAERLPNNIPEEPQRSMTVSPVSPVDGHTGQAVPLGHGFPPSPLDGKPLPIAKDAAVAADIAGAAAVGVAAAGLTRKTSIRKDGPAALDLTVPPSLGAVPPSPAGTEFSFHSVSPDQAPAPSSSAAAIAAAGGPPTSTVHRVQLDFKPTLEDEMELRAGQLVRLLHEYDDGWALCIRLDRSEQGVVPRTCLSTRPVKPRPAQNGGPRGPPVNPQRGPNHPQGQRPRGPPGPHGPHGPMRGPNGPGPQGPPAGYPRPESPMRPGSAQGRRPQSPAGGRPASPAGGPMHGGRPQSPGPRFQPGRPQSPASMRPQSPAGMRSQSPAGMRSQSPSSASRRQSPPGPSLMNQEYRPGPGGPPAGPVGRKPLPGQAC